MTDRITAQEILDYSMGLLDDAHRAAFEQQLAGDEALARRVAGVSRSLETLLDDGPGPEPPAGLASRAVAFVAARRNQRSFQDFVPARVPFGWADVAVAAVVFFAAILTLTIPLQRSREMMNQANCAYNLHTVGTGFAKYAATHGHFPFQSPEYPTGAWSVELLDNKVIPNESVVTCPSCGKRVEHLPAGGAELKELLSRSPSAAQELFGPQYAYHLGYRSGSRVLTPVSDTPQEMVAIAGDQPAHNRQGLILVGNSPNHGGRGQNILFSDGHVRWLSKRWLSKSDPDIFLNNAQRLEPGLHPGDAVLVPSGLPAHRR